MCKSRERVAMTSVKDEARRGREQYMSKFFGNALGVSKSDTSENDISKSDTSKSDMSNIDISKTDRVSNFDTPSKSDISKIDTLEAMKELNNVSLFAVWKVLDSLFPGGEGEVSQRQLSQLMGISLNSLKKYFRDLERRGFMEFNI